MSGSPAVKQSLSDVLAYIGGITTQEAAQEFVDVVSSVKRIPLILLSTTSDPIVLPYRSWILMKSRVLN